MSHKDSNLQTWAGLNDFLRSTDEAECNRLLKLELKGAKRKVVALRIHSRLNYLRAHRERAEILAATGA